MRNDIEMLKKSQNETTERYATLEATIGRGMQAFNLDLIEAKKNSFPTNYVIIGISLIIILISIIYFLRSR